MEWTYNLFFHTDRAPRLSRVLEIARGLGWQACAPLTRVCELSQWDTRDREPGRLSVWRFDLQALDMVPVQVETDSDLEGLDVEPNLNLDLWDETGSISLWIDPSRIVTMPQRELAQPPDLPPIGHISIGMYRSTDLSPQDADDLTTRMTALFTTLCVETQALYGFSDGDDSLDCGLTPAGKVREVWAGLPPSRLHWLNYFAPAHAARLDLGRLRALSLLVEELDLGTLVRLSVGPADIPVIDPDRLRRAWLSE